MSAVMKRTQAGKCALGTQPVEIGDQERCASRQGAYPHWTVAGSLFDLDERGEELGVGALDCDENIAGITHRIETEHACGSSDSPLAAR